MSKLDIKKEKTYLMFKNILKTFESSKKEGLILVFKELDRRKSFKSQTNANYAIESLNQLIIDENLEKCITFDPKQTNIIDQINELGEV